MARHESPGQVAGTQGGRQRGDLVPLAQLEQLQAGRAAGRPHPAQGEAIAGHRVQQQVPCRIDVRRIGALKDGEEQVGQRVKAKIVKNKVAPPFRIAEFDMMHNNGISYEGDLLDLGTTHGVVSRSGAWFKYGETYLGQGKEKARNFLIENTDVSDEIKQKVMVAGGFLPPADEAPMIDDAAELDSESKAEAANS